MRGLSAYCLSVHACTSVRVRFLSVWLGRFRHLWALSNPFYDSIRCADSNRMALFLDFTPHSLSVPVSAVKLRIISLVQLLRNHVCLRAFKYYYNYVHVNQNVIVRALNITQPKI